MIPRPRDPKRIQIVLDNVRRVWEMYPDLRLGQLIFSLAECARPGCDPFYVEEDDLLFGVDQFIARARKADTVDFDKRMFARRTLDVPRSVSLLDHNGHRHPVSIANWTEAGLGIICDIALPQGKQVEIIFNEGWVKGEVRHCTPKDYKYVIGIQLTSENAKSVVTRALK